MSAPTSDWHAMLDKVAAAVADALDRTARRDRELAATESDDAAETPATTLLKYLTHPPAAPPDAVAEADRLAARVDGPLDQQERELAGWRADLGIIARRLASPPGDSRD